MPKSSGVLIVLLLAAASSTWLFLHPPRAFEGAEFWAFSQTHLQAMRGFVERWNAENPARKVRPVLLSLPALERRLLSGFMSGTPVAPFFEIEQGIAARLTSGPVAEIGLRDLTDTLDQEGLLKAMNAPSFSPWTVKDRIYGLPHDVHPVVLAYRADIVEAAGIDMGEIQTWEDFIRVLGPLQRRVPGRGSEDRYLLNLWPTNTMAMEILLLQAGGDYFDASGRPAVNSEANVRVLATLASWCTGKTRIALDAPEFSASGNRLKLDGQVIASLMPDWLAGTWKNDLPALGGKLKLVPLPAWGKGGRRTSVYGGTMLGFPKNGPDFSAAWKFGSALYRSPAMTDTLFSEVNIIPPDRSLWTRRIYHEPDSYFSGQAAGEIFIAQAPDVPLRRPSPFTNQARDVVGKVFQRLVDHADKTGAAAPEALWTESRRLLAEAQQDLARQMDRNVFQRNPQ